MLRNLNFEIPADMYRKWKASEPIDESWKEIKIPEEYDFLYDYQKEALQFAIFHNFNVLFSLDTGLGKSLTSLVSVDLVDNFPVLLVAPKSVKLGWIEDYEKFINKGDVFINIKGSEMLKNYNDKYDIFLTSYGTYARNVEYDKKGKPVFSENLKEFKANDFKMIILDEAQKLGGEDTKTNEALQFLAEDIDHRVALTATPFLNSPKEMFNILKLLRPDLFKNRFSYLNRYCSGDKDSYSGKDKFNGARNTAELHDILTKEVMIRFLKHNVLKDLPKYTTKVVSMELENRGKYDDLFKYYEEKISKINPEDPKAQNIFYKKTNDLRQEIYQQKKLSCFEFVETLLESEDKVLIFSHHTMVLEDLEKKFKGSIVTISGATSEDERYAKRDKFIEDPKIKIIAGNMKCLGEGFNRLQEVCSVMCFFEFPFHPGMLDQCIGRLMRIKQKNHVMVYLLAGLDTIDEMFFRIIDKKRGMFDQIIDGKTDKEIEETTTLEDMVNAIKRGYERRLRKERRRIKKIT